MSPPAISVRTAAIPLLVLLGIELVLGISLNLFVNLPMGATVTAVLSSQPILDLHILDAALLVGVSTLAVVLSRSEPTRRPALAAALALVSALGASAGGWEFVFNGQDPASAGVMVLGFLGVLVGAILLRAWGSRTVAGATPSTAVA